MGKHSIIVIKNKNKEYLQYYDTIWNSYLFPNCKLSNNITNEIIINYIKEILNINKEEIACTYIGEKTHTKYSQKDKKYKEYTHYFYNVAINNLLPKLKEKEFIINNVTYTWLSNKELENKQRIKEVNSDIISYIKEFNL